MKAEFPEKTFKKMFLTLLSKKWLKSIQVAGYSVCVVELL